MRILLALALGILPGAARADGDFAILKSGENLLSADNVALNGTQAALTTISIATAGHTCLRLTPKVTMGGAAANLKMFCEESDDESTWRQIHPPDASGTVTPSQPIYKWDSGSDVNTSWRVNVAAYRFVRCYFSGDSANASDIVNKVTGAIQ